MGLMSKLAFAAAASALSLLAAEAQAEVTVVVPQLDEPRTLSPNFSSDTGGYAPSSNIYSHLVTMDWGVVKGTARLRRPCRKLGDVGGRQDGDVQAVQERQMA